MDRTEALLERLSGTIGEESALKAMILFSGWFLEFAERAAESAQEAEDELKIASYAVLSGSYIGMAEALHKCACNDTNCGFDALMALLDVRQ